MVAVTAEEAVKRLGADAVAFSYDQAEMARALGDAGSAVAWADIADAAAVRAMVSGSQVSTIRAISHRIARSLSVSAPISSAT